MRPRTIWRVARWEALGGAGGVDRRTLGLAVLGVVVLGVLVPVAATTGPAADAGLYRAGIAPDSPYYAPAEAAPEIAVVEPDRGAFDAGRLDLLVLGREVHVRDSQTGRAAASALRSAVEAHNDRLMGAEPDRAAAFPVVVELRYVTRDVGVLVRRGGSEEPVGAARAGSTPADGDPGTPATGSAESVATLSEAESGSGLTGYALPGLSLVSEGSSGTPAAIRPPFPFVSLVLAFAFVVPMNFVVQAYASSVLHDRGNRRGEPLLVAPVSKWSVIAGKALPYFTLMMAIAAATAVAVGGGLLSVYAVIPLALVFLAGGFLAGLLARSHKELTFVLVAVSVGVTTFVFVPAIFTDVHPIAAISPLTLVVRDLEGAAVGAGTTAFSTVPAFLTAAVLYGLGGGLYREEDLFAQVPLPTKALDALAAFVTSPRRVGWASLLAIPFVFLAELLVVAFLFVLPLGVALPVLFVAIATVEEVAKSLPAYAGFARGRYGRTGRIALLVGAYSGVGFFVGEKVAAVAQVVGLFELDLGRVAFELGAGVGGAAAPGLLGLLLLAPLALHAVTASITAYGASRGANWYAVSLAAAIIVHTAYNLGVVVLVG